MQIADKLRKSILQAAIQGRLTEQLPTDGSAKDLLAQIKTEKEKLIAEGKCASTARQQVTEHPTAPWCRKPPCKKIKLHLDKFIFP